MEKNLSQATPAPHALRVAGTEPLTLDPGRAMDVASGSKIDQLFSGLVTLSPEMGVVPDVARRWEAIDGGRKYVFHLRDDVRWSDGVPVTAGDFEYAWKRVLDPTTESGSANYLYDIQGARAFHRGEAGREDVGVRAADEWTLTVELEGPTGYFLHLLACTVTYPVPRHAVEAHGEAWTEVGNLVTNGPYRLHAWNRGESMALVRNPDYYGQFGGNVERVEWYFLSEEPTRLARYEADGLDTIGLSPPEMDRARQRHAGEYISGPILLTDYLGFDVRRPPFDDAQVRRAFVLATDREKLADVTLRGYPLPATGGYVPPGMPGHLPGIGLPHDPEGARRLLAEAGYPDGRGFPALDALAPDSPSFVPIFEGLQAQWQENLGVRIAWQAIEYRIFVDRMAGQLPQMWCWGWLADYPDPDNFLRVSLATANTRWQNQAYDRLVEEARREVDQEKRMHMYQRAERILVEEAPIVPLLYGRFHSLLKPYVTQFPTSPINAWFYKDVVIEPH